MNRLKNLVARLLRDEQGQDLIEYALLGALISVTLTAILIAVSDAVEATFQRIIDSLGA
jgi:Flp pilus assembly pilin Flp